MRLRQLGTTHTVVFFAPPEVNQSILDVRENRDKDVEVANTSNRSFGFSTVGLRPYTQPITSFDVVRWLLEQTCRANEQLQPLYFAQGLDFCRRFQAAVDEPDFLTKVGPRTTYLATLLQQEQQTLVELYAPKPKQRPHAIDEQQWCTSLAGFVTHLQSRKAAFQDDGCAVQPLALQEVEQEREVAFEVEAVRSVQKPRLFHARVFPGLHPDLRRFVKTGYLPAPPTGGESLLQVLARTALGKKHGIALHAGSCRLFASIELSRTVHLFRGESNDNFIVSLLPIMIAQRCFTWVTANGKSSVK